MTAVPQAGAQRVPAVWAEAPAPATLALGPPAFSWSHPESGLHAAAFGEAARRDGGSLHALFGELDVALWPEGAPELPGPWFGALAFDPRGDSVRGPAGDAPSWRGFQRARWVLPRLLCWSRNGRHFAAAFGEGCDEALRDALARLGPQGARGERAAEPVPLTEPAGSGRVRVVAQAGERERWTALVARALSAIGRSEIDKVVLARAIRVEAERDLDPARVLAALARRHPSCRTFLLRGDDGTAFLGATPETFCRLDGADLRTEALAGSARPGDGAALLGRQKELREHRWVVDHLVRGLEGLARGPVQRRPEPGVRELANVAHLVTPIAARLAPGRSLADVVGALHPTPAVAGVPTEAALRFLAAHEELDRGLYAGLVGWAGAGHAELAVALRSALVRGREAVLFVGAGIVAGSSPDAEWAETELKSRALLDALGAPGAAL